MYDRIPKVIYQTWKTKNLSEIKDNDHIKSIQSIKKYNENYKHIIYDDNDCHEFIKNNYPEYYESYVKLKLPVQKADLWRYLIIYKYGGFYMDMDCICVKKLDDFQIPSEYNAVNNLLIIEEELIRDDKFDKIECYSQYAQYWFGATPYHPIILSCILKVISNIQENKKFNYTIDNQTIFLTGPVPWSKAIHEYPNKSEIYINKRSSLDYLFIQVLNVTGNHPIIHLCKGTWRQEKDDYTIVIIVLIIIIILIVFITILWIIKSYTS